MAQYMHSPVSGPEADGTDVLFGDRGRILFSFVTPPPPDIVDEIDSIKSRHDALASTHDVMACRQDKMAESLSDIQAALASLNASGSDVAATVGKIAQGGGAEKGSGGDALRRSLAVDSFLRAHFLSHHGPHLLSRAAVMEL